MNALQRDSCARGPVFHLTANSPPALDQALRGADITVPLSTEGRTTSHIEQHMMARFLSTCAGRGWLKYPLALEHSIRSSLRKPDFVLTQGDDEIGVECVQAISEDWARILEINERDYPDQVMYGQQYAPGEPCLSEDEKHDTACGRVVGKPWVGEMPVQNWADAMSHVIGKKLLKLRSGNYDYCSRVWLLVHDEWPVPLNSDDALFAAARALSVRLRWDPSDANFESIFICSRNWLLRFDSGGFYSSPLVYL